MFEKRANELGGFDFLGAGHAVSGRHRVGVGASGPRSSSRAITTSADCPSGCISTLVEPLRDLFKDEVRRVGRDLGLDESSSSASRFPGPGLAVRLLGEITKERLDLLRLADEIVAEEIRKAGWYERLWQSFAVLLPVQSVGVMGDARTYEYTVAIRAVESLDGMTADWARLPHDLLAAISSRIVNEVRGINRVVYDISSKPTVDRSSGNDGESPSPVNA